MSDKFNKSTPDPAAAALLAAWPRTLHACAVCFGQSDDPNVIRAYTWGIFILIATTFAALAALVYAVYRIEAGRAAAHKASQAGLGPWHRNGKPAPERSPALRP